MILCDAGPLVALINALDARHSDCVAALERLPSTPLLTTWACLAEAMYMLRRAGGFVGQDALWNYLAEGDLAIHRHGEAEWRRMRELMRQYQDAPMDLADASLVVAAEQFGVRRVFSLDRHFHIYRIHGTHAFEVLP